MLYSTLFSAATLFFGLTVAAPIAIDKPASLKDITAPEIEIEIGVPSHRRDLAIPAVIPIALYNLQAKVDTILPEINTEMKAQSLSPEVLQEHISELDSAIKEALDTIKLTVELELPGSEIEIEVTLEAVIAQVVNIVDPVLKTLAVVLEEVEGILGEVVGTVVDTVDGVVDTVVDEVVPTVKVTLGSVTAAVFTHLQAVILVVEKDVPGTLNAVAEAVSNAGLSAVLPTLISHI